MVAPSFDGEMSTESRTECIKYFRNFDKVKLEIVGNGGSLRIPISGFQGDEDEVRILAKTRIAMFVQDIGNLSSMENTWSL